VADQVAEHRQAQEDLVAERAATLGAATHVDDQRQDCKDPENGQVVARKEVRGRQQHPRRQRQLALELVEDHLEAWQHEGHQHDDDHRRHEGDHGRVGHGGLDLLPRLEVTLEVVGQLEQHGVQATGELGRLKDAQVVRREGVGVLTGGRGEGEPAAQRLDHVAEDLLEELVGRLLLDGLEGVQDRDAGLDEHGELA
jgi:hypothetical protein